MPGYSHEDVELGKCTIVVTCAILRRTIAGAQTLILKRAKSEQEGPGLWTIPGGRVCLSDLGKQLEQDKMSHPIWMGVLNRAILREIREETGLGAEMVKPVVFSFPR